MWITKHVDVDMGYQTYPGIDVDYQTYGRGLSGVWTLIIRHMDVDYQT